MAQSHASSSLTQLLKDKNNARNIEMNTGTSSNNNTNNTTTNNIDRSDSQIMESTQSLSVNSNGFSQSFINNNNAHTAVFGSSFNMSSSPMTLNSNNSIGTINTHKSFAQKNYPSLSSSIPYSVPNSNTSENSTTNEDGNAYSNNNNNNNNNNNSASSNNNSNNSSSGSNTGNNGGNSMGNALSGSTGSGSSLENYSGLMPSNIQQINSNVIQSPKVSNVEARFVITKQKLQEKQQQSASYHKSISPANASSYGSNNSSNSAGSNSSKTINHASSFNKKMSSSSFTGGSGVGFGSSSGSAGQVKTHTRSRSGSLSSQLGNLFFNSSSPSNTKSASSSSSSMSSSSFSFSSNSNSTPNSSASKTQSKLTSSLRNSNSALYMNGNSGTNNTNTNTNGNSNHNNNEYGPSDNYNNGSSIQYEKTIEEQPIDDHDGSSSVSKPMRARQSNIYSASRTPVGSLHVNTSGTSSSFTSSNLANNGHKGSEVSSPATPHSLKNSHSNSIAKFFRKSSSSSAMSSPSSSFSSPHGNAGHANNNNSNNNNNKGGSAYNANFSSNNHYSSSPSVSTFNTNAIVNGKNSNGNVNSAASSSLSKHYQENGQSSSSNSSNSTIVDNEQQHSFTSSTFNGPSSLGNTDILYQASNSSHPPPSSSSSLSQQQQQQQQKTQQLAQQSNLPFHKRYLKTGDDLGAGAGGTVKVVKRILDNEVFAVKEFRSKYDSERKRDYIKKITGEYCIGSTLKHPNIIATIEIVYDENRIFQVMEYCDYDLFAIVMSNKMSYDEICCCFKQILNGVEYLHSIGLSHRDLKLDNCVVDKYGIVKLIDFGASVVFSYPFSKNLVTASGIVGSDPYLAPEVCIFTKYDPRPVDVWSTAMIFVCMVLKKFPWKIPKLRDSSFKLFCSGRDCDSLSQLVTRTPNPPKYDDSVTEPTGAGKSADDNHNPKDPKNLNIGPQRLLHNLPEESQHIIGRMVDLAPACRANIDEIMSDPWVESIKMCYVDEHGQIICPDNSHHHTEVDQSVAHIAGLEKNKAQK